MQNRKVFFSVMPLCLCMLLLLSACRKFLDQPAGTTVINPSTIKDLQEMLNHDSIALCNFILADIMSDDMKMSDNALQLDTSSYYARTYLWGKDIWNSGDPDFIYNSAYRRILQMNIILNKIDAVEGSAQQKNIPRAQAQINRAWYYLQLANLYGPHYQSTTAAADLSVPLILQPDAGTLPARATVQDVYNQILKDLNAAVSNPDLPDMGATIVQPGKAAALALLARTYLYMGNYQQAEEAAHRSLVMRNELLDYNVHFIPTTSLLDLSKNPETLMGKLRMDYSGFYSKYTSSFFISKTLGDLFDTNDNRLIKFFKQDGDVYILNWIDGGQDLTYMYFSYSIGVPEVLLTEAECLARRGDTAGALALVNRLRQNRLIQYTPIEGATDVLATVLQERRRELFYHGGLRLFDLKRLNRDPRFAQTLQRTADDGSTVLAVLEPGAPRYLMQFSPLIIANNPHMIQNPR